MPQVIIATAILSEARVIARAFCLPGRFRGTIEMGGEVSVALIGPGGRNLDVVRDAVRKEASRGLIMAGLGGALSPDLRLGDVVVHGDVPTCLPGFGHRLFVGPIASAEQIVGTIEQKAAMYRETGALAVDMETAAARFIAEGMQIPFLAVRAISDTSSQVLEADFLTLVDAAGRTRVGRAIGMLASRPWRLRGMLTVRRSAQLALRNLAVTVKGVVKAGWPRTS